MKLGFCQKNYLKWEDAIDFAVSINAQHIELSIDYLGTNNCHSLSYLNDIKKKIADNNLTVSLHSVNGINLCEKVDKLRNTSFQIMKESIDLASFLGATWITTHLGMIGDVETEKHQERLELACGVLSELKSYNNNVLICIENLQCYNKLAKKRNLMDSIDDILFLQSYFKNIPINFTIDIGHLFIHNSTQKRKEMLSIMLQYAKCIHIHSNDGYEDTHSALNNLFLREVLREDWQYLRSIPVCVECYSLEDIKTSFNVIKEYEKERSENL